jgi:hypothetical protein
MTVVGGRTSLVDLALSSVTNTAGDFLTLSGGVVHKRTAAQTLTDIGGQAALTNPVTGTGTTNYLPKFTGASTIGNSIVFDNGTNVGIGTSSPTMPIANRNGLVIRGGSNGAEFNLQSTSATDGTSVGFALVAFSTDAYYVNRLDGNHIWATGSGGNTERMRIWGSTGNVHIGATPTSDNGLKLQVSGDIYASNEMYLDNGKYLRFKRSSGGLFIQTLGIDSGTDNVRLLTTGDLNIVNGSLTNLMTVKNGGNVGIGTTASPGSKFVVVGNSGQLTGNYRFNSAILQDQTTFRGVGFGFKSDEQLGVIYGESAGAGSNLAFMTYSGSAFLERTRITSGGDLYVGSTTEPGAGSPTTGCALTGVGAIIAQRNGAPAGYFGRGTNDGILFEFLRGTTLVGSISVTTVMTSYNVTSDYRLKEDLQEIKGLEKVQAIKVYDYKWKSQNSRMDGVLAHELAEVLPYAVNGQKDGIEMQGVDYSKIVPILIKSIQELKQEIDTLKN